MADSNITKLALSRALKELLKEQSFEKISVSDICDRCHMNRKSFYYHFRDKFDLANWIFDTEFVELIRKKELDIMKNMDSFDERWKVLEVICVYFYENRTFFRRILMVEGQNSFSAHFRGFLHPLMHMRMVSIFGEDDIPQMVYDFLVDGIVCAIERWLLEKECVPVDAFITNLKKLLQTLYLALHCQISDDPKWLGETAKSQRNSRSEIFRSAVLLILRHSSTKKERGELFGVSAAFLPSRFLGSAPVSCCIRTQYRRYPAIPQGTKGSKCPKR